MGDGGGGAVKTLLSSEGKKGGSARIHGERDECRLRGSVCVGGGVGERSGKRRRDGGAQVTGTGGQKVAVANHQAPNQSLIPFRSTSPPFRHKNV